MHCKKELIPKKQKNIKIIKKPKWIYWKPMRPSATRGYAKEEDHIQKTSICKTNGKSSKDRKPTKQAAKYCINKEIIHLYYKENNLKNLLYQLHLIGADYHRGTWQHALLQIDDTRNNIMEMKCRYSQIKINNLTKITNGTYTNKISNNYTNTKPEI